MSHSSLFAHVLTKLIVHAIHAHTPPTKLYYTRVVRCAVPPPLPVQTTLPAPVRRPRAPARRPVVNRYIDC